MTVKAQVYELFTMINSSFYKNFLKGDRDAIISLYELSQAHLEIKLFELGLSKDHKDIIKAGFEDLMVKHLDIFHRVHCLHEDTLQAVTEVLELTKEEIDELNDLLK